MQRLLQLSPNWLLAIWFLALGLCGGMVAAIGPAPSAIAILSRSDGVFITYGAAYATIGAAAFLLTMLLIHWRLAGTDAFFKFGPSGAARSSLFGQFLIVAAYAYATLASCYFIFVHLGKTLLCAMPHDAFVYYDGAERVAHGQLQHVDFHTPMGVLCNVIPYLGLQATGSFAGSLEMGSLFAAAFLLGIGSYALASRYTLAFAIPLVVYFGLLVVVPLGIEGAANEISTAMFYNRLGWTALTFTFLYYVEPNSVSSRRLALDAVTLAFLILFAFYLKISYALVGIAFLALMGLTSSYNRKLAAATLGVVLLAMGGLEIAYGFHAGYIEDLRMTLKACGTNRGSRGPKFFANIREFLMAGVASALFLTVPRYRFANFLTAGYMIVAGLLVIDQNTHYRGVICLLALFAIAGELIRRSAESQTEGSLRSQAILKSLVCLCFVAIFSVEAIANRFVAMAMIRSAVTEINPDHPNGLKGMVFAQDLWNHLQQRRVPNKRTGKGLATPDELRENVTTIYPETVANGIAALRDVDTIGKRIMAFDFVSPFAFALFQEPPVGGHTCIHYGRTMSEQSFSPPDELLGEVDYVMVPHRASDPVTRDFLLKVYGEYLDRHFSKLKESDDWTILVRNEEAEAETPQEVTSDDGK